ncbi:MAG: hypothetical protein ABIS23_08420 [Sphingomicrobium sp.]
MFDRRLFGDVAIAILLAVPTVALSRPQSTDADHPSVASPLVETSAFSDHASAESLVDLPAK